jgi:hypothetical protein
VVWLAAVDTVLLINNCESQMSRCYSLPQRLYSQLRQYGASSHPVAVIVGTQTSRGKKPFGSVIIPN